MATPRKRWFRVAESILRDEMTVEQRSTFLGLLAWFNQRRARDGVRGSRAQEASIPPGDLLTITLQTTLDAAREFLRDVEKRFDLTIEERGAFTHVSWPMLAKFQEWGRPQNAPTTGRKRPERRPENAPRAAPSETEPNRTISEPEPKKKKSKNGRAPKLPRTDAPEQLTPEGRQYVAGYFADVSPGCVALDLEPRIESALRYYRREGKRFVDWAAAVVDNIVSLENLKRERNGEPKLRTREQARDLNRQLESAKQQELTS